MGGAVDIYNLFHSIQEKEIGWPHLFLRRLWFLLYPFIDFVEYYQISVVACFTAHFEIALSSSVSTPTTPASVVILNPSPLLSGTKLLKVNTTIE